MYSNENKNSTPVSQLKLISISASSTLSDMKSFYLNVTDVNKSQYFPFLSILFMCGWMGYVPQYGDQKSSLRKSALSFYPMWFTRFKFRSQAASTFTGWTMSLLTKIMPSSSFASTKWKKDMEQRSFPKHQPVRLDSTQSVKEKVSSVPYSPFLIST